MASPHRNVQAYTAGKILRILSSPDTSAQKAALANLRRGIGHEPGAIPQLWGEYLLDMPEEMYGKNGKPSREEWAIYTALTLFALHQQGHDPALEPMHCTGQRIGAAVGRLVEDENDLERVMRRLNAAATANTPTAFAHYLRGLIQLLRASSIPVDYADLAGDIYLYQLSDYSGQVRLKWGQDFYRQYHKKSIKKESEES